MNLKDIDLRVNAMFKKYIAKYDLSGQSETGIDDKNLIRYCSGNIQLTTELVFTEKEKVKFRQARSADMTPAQIDNVLKPVREDYNETIQYKIQRVKTENGYDNMVIY